MTLDAKEKLTENIWGNVEPVLLNAFETLLQKFLISHRIQMKMQSTEVDVKYLFIYTYLIIFGIQPEILKLFMGFNPKY